MYQDDDIIITISATRTAILGIARTICNNNTSTTTTTTTTATTIDGIRQLQVYQDSQHGIRIHNLLSGLCQCQFAYQMVVILIRLGRVPKMSRNTLSGAYNNINDQKQA